LSPVPCDTHEKKAQRVPRGYSIHHCSEQLATDTERARVGDHYAVQGHPRSLILVPFKSSYATSWITLTFILSHTVARAVLIIKLSLWSGVPLSLTNSLSETPGNFAISHILPKTRFCGLCLRFCRRQHASIFNHFTYNWPWKLPNSVE